MVNAASPPTPCKPEECGAGPTQAEASSTGTRGQAPGRSPRWTGCSSAFISRYVTADRIAEHPYGGRWSPAARAGSCDVTAERGDDQFIMRTRLDFLERFEIICPTGRIFALSSERVALDH